MSRRSLLAVGSLCFGMILGLVALILGLNARRQIAESQGRLTGDGMAIAGIVLGIVDIAFWALFIFLRLALI